MKHLMSYVKYLFLVLLFINLSSCLTAGLDEDLPVYTDAKITAFNFEYRWIIKEGISEKLQVKTMQTETVIKDGLVECEIVVPPASGTFTEEVRKNVLLSNLVGYCTISTASTIIPLGNTPVLGKTGDFSQSNMIYEITAADNKNVKQWTLIINDFSK